MSAAASIATLTWHDLETNIQDEHAISRAYGKPDDSLFRVKLCYILRNIWVKNRLCTFKICSPERSDYSNINKIHQSTKSI